MNRLYVQLGKAGDLCNLLQIAWLDVQDGHEVSVMTSQKYTNILEGTSVVSSVVPFVGEHFEIERAMTQARGMSGYDSIVCTSFIGSPEAVKKWTLEPAGLSNGVTTSFQKEMWKVAGRLHQWDSCPPLMFDKRNSEREAKLVREVLGERHGPKRKIILMALNSDSSPMKYSWMLERIIRAEFKVGYRVIDLNRVKAERFYDLLALYEHADCLIAADTAPLHLAWAVKDRLPVVALTHDERGYWYGSPWRPNHVLYCRYNDIPDRCEEIIDAIAEACIGTSPCAPTSVPIIHHVYWQPNGEKYSEAMRKKLTAWQPLPIRPGMTGRDATLPDVGSSQRIPYLKHCIRMGLQRCNTSDMVCLSKSGLTMAISLSGVIRECRPVWCGRIRKDETGNKTVAPPADLFAAPPRYWRSKLPVIPDLLLGNDYEWGKVLKQIFRSDGAVEATGMVWRES